MQMSSYRWEAYGALLGGSFGGLMSGAWAYAWMSSIKSPEKGLLFDFKQVWAFYVGGCLLGTGLGRIWGSSWGLFLGALLGGAWMSSVNGTDKNVQIDFNTGLGRVWGSSWGSFWGLMFAERLDPVKVQVRIRAEQGRRHAAKRFNSEAAQRPNLLGQLPQLERQM